MYMSMFTPAGTDLQQRVNTMQGIFNSYETAFRNRYAFVDDGELACLFGNNAFQAIQLLDRIDFNNLVIAPCFMREVIKNMPSLAQKTLVLNHLRALKAVFVDSITLDIAIRVAEEEINSYVNNQA